MNLFHRSLVQTRISWMPVVTLLVLFVMQTTSKGQREELRNTAHQPDLRISDVLHVATEWLPGLPIEIQVNPLPNPYSAFRLRVMCRGDSTAVLEYCNPLWIMNKPTVEEQRIAVVSDHTDASKRFLWIGPASVTGEFVVEAEIFEMFSANQGGEFRRFAVAPADPSRLFDNDQFTLDLKHAVSLSLFENPSILRAGDVCLELRVDSDLEVVPGDVICGMKIVVVNADFTPLAVGRVVVSQEAIRQLFVNGLHLVQLRRTDLDECAFRTAAEAGELQAIVLSDVASGLRESEKGPLWTGAFSCPVNSREEPGDGSSTNNGR